jgi:hypothetical protein
MPLRPSLTALVLSSFALAACSGGGATAPAGPAASSVAHSALSTAKIAVDASARTTQGDYGGVPAFTGDVALFDAPLAGYSAVNIALTEVDAVATNGTVTALVKYATPNIVNLLSLQTAALPISGTLPGGSYAGIQLVGVVAKCSATTTAGKTIPVSFRNTVGTTFTLPVGVSFASTTGAAVHVAVDFNLAESISANLLTGVAGVAGGDVLQLAPLLIANVNAGSVAGTVVNEHGQPVTQATIVITTPSGVPINSTLTASDGTFNLHAIPYGQYGTSYSITVYNAYFNAAGTEFFAANYDGWWASSFKGPGLYLESAQTSVGTIED